jgi:endonuclease/exonuclease/phosphatase family metal-dependent hydrolase
VTAGETHTSGETHRAIEATFRIERARLIAGLARMVRNIDLAEELAQDALVTALAEWPRTGVPANWAEQEDDYGHNLICLGDFNIDRKDDPQYQAFVSTGLTPAPAHEKLPRTIFSKAGRPDLDSFFDQIAWFQTIRNKPYLTLGYRKGGNFDFRGQVMTTLTMQQLSYRLSDHFPLWVEFGR